MQKTHRCPKCHSEKVGYFEKLPDSGGRLPYYQSIGSSVKEQGIFTSTDQWHEVCAFVCTSCGYLEHYVKNVKDVPFDKLENYKPLN